MRHYCPACHSSEGFNLMENIETRIQCSSCGHIFEVEAVLLLCSVCVDRTPHYEHRREGKFHKEEIFARTCLKCGHYQEI